MYKKDVTKPKEMSDVPFSQSQRLWRQFSEGGRGSNMTCDRLAVNIMSFFFTNTSIVKLQYHTNRNTKKIEFNHNIN